MNDSPTDAQYNPPNTDVPGNGLSETIGSLPFTGEDLILIAAVAVFLIIAGYFLRKASKIPV